MQLENMVWLAAGVGLGLFLAMVLLSLGIMRDRWAYRRRLRTGRRASAAMGPAEPVMPVVAARPSPVMARKPPTTVETPVPEPAARPVVADPVPVEGPSHPVEPAQSVPPDRVVIATPPAAEEAEPTKETEAAPVAALSESSPEPAAPAAEVKPEAPASTGIQAAVAAALEKRRAERAARGAAGGGEAPPVVAPAGPVRQRPATDNAAEAAVSSVNVEELFAKAFEASTAEPPAPESKTEGG